MNGEFAKRNARIADQMVKSIRAVEKRGGLDVHGGLSKEEQANRIGCSLSAASIGMQQLQIELDEETADRMGDALDDLINAIGNLTEAVKAERAFELNLGDGRISAGWIGIPCNPPKSDASRTSAPGEKVIVCTEGDVMGPDPPSFDDDEDRDADERNDEPTLGDA